MQPVVCNKDMAVVFPLKDGDCEFWLEIVDSVNDITNPSRDHAYVDSKGLFYIYNGKNIVAINDHANLKIKCGNMIGDISNQLDLAEILNQFVKTISVNGTTDYYVLTESKDKNVKKLDYYFKYDLNYLPTAPYYSINFFVRDLDLEGYTVKRSYLSDNTCKLKNKSTGELIDYVYFMLDDNVTVTTSKDDQQLTYTTIAIKYLPYFAKLKTDTPVSGQLHVDMCISIILEKTSS